MEIIFEDYSKFHNIITKVGALTEELYKMIPNAIESGLDLANVIYTIKNDISRVNGDYKNYYNSIDQSIIAQYKEEVTNIIEDGRKICSQIITDFQEEIQKK